MSWKRRDELRFHSRLCLSRPGLRDFSYLSIGYGYRARLEQFRFRWQKDGTFEFKDDRNRHAFDVVYGWNSEDERERMEMIRKWVAENSITPADIAGPNSGGGLAVTIFNRIFEQYARGADIAALWQETSTSGPFRLEELAGENR